MAEVQGASRGRLAGALDAYRTGEEISEDDAMKLARAELDAARKARADAPPSGRPPGASSPRWPAQCPFRPVEWLDRVERKEGPVTVIKSERTERERVVAEAIHSAEMEGLTVSEAAVSDSAAYVAGQIDSAELVARARARYGLD
ncbi:hypothetical protein GCM10027062_32570 [Nocardioides hungaricus]